MNRYRSNVSSAKLSAHRVNFYLESWCITLHYCMMTSAIPAVILEDALISLPPIRYSSKVAIQSLRDEATRSAAGRSHHSAAARSLHHPLYRFTTLSKEGS
jgi:hypothetical protein